jgi:hypothetical protein
MELENAKMKAEETRAAEKHDVAMGTAKETLSQGIYNFGTGMAKGQVDAETARQGVRLKQAGQKAMMGRADELMQIINEGGNPNTNVKNIERSPNGKEFLITQADGKQFVLDDRKFYAWYNGFNPEVLKAIADISKGEAATATKGRELSTAELRAYTAARGERLTEYTKTHTDSLGNKKPGSPDFETYFSSTYTGPIPKGVPPTTGPDGKPTDLTIVKYNGMSVYGRVVNGKTQIWQGPDGKPVQAVAGEGPTTTQPEVKKPAISNQKTEEAMDYEQVNALAETYIEKQKRGGMITGGSAAGMKANIDLKETIVKQNGEAAWKQVLDAVERKQNPPKDAGYETPKQEIPEKTPTGAWIPTPEETESNRVQPKEQPQGAIQNKRLPTAAYINGKLMVKDGETQGGWRLPTDAEVTESGLSKTAPTKTEEVKSGKQYRVETTSEGTKSTQTAEEADRIYRESVDAMESEKKKEEGGD